MVRKFLLLGIIFISIFTITTSVDAFTISKSVGNNIGLIGHWTFDGIDMVGGKAWDISGSGNHGTLTNISTSTFYTKGKIGQGLNFDGSDDYVSLSSDPVSSYSSSHSYCAWFNSSVSNIQQSIVSTLTDTNNNAMLGLSSTGIVSFYYKGGSASYGGYKSGVYSTNTWTYLCGVFDGSSVKIYKDGVDVGSLLTHHVNAAGNRVGKSTYNYTGYIFNYIVL